MAEANYVSVRDGTTRVSYTLLSGAGVATNPHGATQHTDVTRELFIPASDDLDPNASPERISGFPVIRVIDGVVTRNAYGFLVPDDFVAFQSVKAIWESPVAPGNMYWTMEAYYGAEGEAHNAHSDVPALGVTATAGIRILNVQESPTPLTLASLAIGDYVGIRVNRTANHGNDTIDNLVDFFGLLFTYTAEQ